MKVQTQKKTQNWSNGCLEFLDYKKHECMCVKQKYHIKFSY